MARLKRKVTKASSAGRTRSARVRVQHRFNAGTDHQIMMSNRKKRNRAANRVARKARRIARRHKR